ncbi:hypothetical protein RY831_25835 [Noviherbaspirillum sp. CPCC 100848]|uniref:Uncharacterized protein n=1 Tax=Noviherbaspirillum album TaxID=3080276 RepID=A0ABU6JFZ3_9BURK|nr:hypothetical protein [Noviherbaspirillum sp. CPCC 100848]MEC4722591.1 hypothetical protein [Noviherbaspirillum sp. CPCC 100848]
MANTQSLQIFLNQGKPEQDLLIFLGSLLGFLVESTDCEIPNATGFVQVTDYIQGFKQGLLITWPSTAQLSLEPAEIARSIATNLDVSVLLESELDENGWILASPSGQLKKTTVTYLDDGIDLANY